MSTLTADRSLVETDCLSDVEVVPADTSSTSLLELLLKEPARLDALLRDQARQREAVPRLLALALAGFAIYGLAATVVLNALLETRDYWPAGVPAAHWSDRSVANLLVAYCLGLVAANGVCLPSFYFYGLLAGVQTTMLGVTAHAMKGLAASALALVGILPVYVSLALAVIVFPLPEKLLAVTSALGLALPFIAGLWGVRSLYQGFVCLSDTIPSERRGDRACFLRRLLVAWCGCYTAVTPLMIYTLWNHFSG
ncbi:MAG TPA: hypothetical protein VGX78_12490 [Pirellulales bacterium]|jgi:hypothetical protein|nr:hypothetical protein [Pirellulales bacterium]